MLAIPVRHLQKTPVLAKLVKTSSQPEERNRKIVELYLRAWNTQEAIADVMGVDRTVVTRIVQKDSSGDLHNDFKPPIKATRAWVKLFRFRQNWRFRNQGYARMGETLKNA